MDDKDWLAQRFEQQLRRPNTVHRNALRSQQQFDGLKDMRLIVGNQNANSLLFTWNGPPPGKHRFSLRRLSLRGLRKPSRWRVAKRVGLGRA